MEQDNSPNRSLLQAAVQNHHLLNGCSMHVFPAVDELPEDLSKVKFECTRCGGTMRPDRVLDYIAGYEAAGGDGRDVWASWDRVDEPC